MAIGELNKDGMIEIAVRELTVTGFLLDQINNKKFNIHTFFGFFFLTLSVVLTIFHLAVGWFGPPEAHLFRSFHLMLVLASVFIFYPVGRKSWNDAIRWPFMIVDMILILCAIMTEVYYLLDVSAYAYRIPSPAQMDVWVSAVVLILVLEATRRAVGWPMIIIALFFGLHALYANSFPGILFGPPTSFKTFIAHTVMEESGVYGTPIAVVASFVVLFIIFGTILRLTGGAKFFLNIALSLTGKRTGGPAKAAVVSSMFFGSISGSTVANVVSTGTFTIPLMKSVGYKNHFAGAVEAAASTGGAIMPPIMGAAAFIVAGFLGIGYWDVALAAFIPALIYYSGLFMMIHFRAQKRGLLPLPADLVPSFSATFKYGWSLLIPLIVLIVLLASGRSAALAVTWSILLLFIMICLNKSTRPTHMTMIRVCEEVMRSTMVVSIATACAGIIVSATTISGIGLKLSWAVMDISGGNLLLALVLVMLVSIVLGMGLPTTAVYITLYVTLIPILLQFGVVPLAAHLFALYYGVLSNVIPPVSIAAYAAAGVAKSKPMKTAWTAFFISVCGLLVPFAFVYRPELLLTGSALSIIWAFACGMLAVITLSAAVIGYFSGDLKIISRIILLGAGVLSLAPGKLTDVSAFSIAVIFMLILFLKNRYKAKKLARIDIEDESKEVYL